MGYSSGVFCVVTRLLLGGILYLFSSSCSFILVLNLRVTSSSRIFILRLHLECTSQAFPSNLCISTSAICSSPTFANFPLLPPFVSVTHTLKLTAPFTTAKIKQMPTAIPNTYAATMPCCATFGFKNEYTY